MASPTISINYDIVETGTTIRTSLFDDMVGIMATNGYDWKNSVIGTNSITLTAISNMVFIRTDNPVTLVLNGTSGTTTISSTQLFFATAAFSSVVISNSNTGTSVNAAILSF